MYPKTRPLISKALREAARGKSCVRCDTPYSSQGCHYTGLRQHEFGKGVGIKGHDLMQADLCTPCHQYFDIETIHKSIEKSEEFFMCIARTVIRRYNEGVIVIKKENKQHD